MKSKQLKSFIARQYGQGMTEYIIITALVAIAAIGAFTYFGSTTRHVVAGMATELAGKPADTEIGLADTNGAALVTSQAAAKKGMGTYNGN